MKPITSSNTKNEILDAYQQLMESYETEIKQNKVYQKQLEEKDNLIKKAQDSSKTGSSSLEELKLAFINQIDQFKEKFDTEKQKFNDIQEALKLQSLELENLHGIKAKSESINALVTTHKNAKEQLENEIKFIKNNWEREKEEYEYNLKLRQRNDEDSYQLKNQKLDADIEEKKEKFNKEISSRENEIKEKEHLFDDMKNKIDFLEKQLVLAVSEKEKEITEKLTKEFNFAKQLENKDLETEIKLLKLEIETLKAKVNEQVQVIDSLYKKQAEASHQVQEIAIKAIEGSSKRVEIITDKSQGNI